MARRCLETVTLDGQTHTCVVLSSEGLAALRQENQVLKNMGYPVLNSLITTFGDVWVDSRDLYNTDAYSQVVNGNGKLRNFLEGTKTDSTRRNGIMLNGTTISYDNTSANYPYNGLYRGFVVDDDTKESWVLGGVVAITAYGNSALASNYYSSPAVYCALMNMAFDTSNGGGATHIAKVTGQLSSLSNNLSDILMVSGGGGGGLIIGEDTYAGKDAGGISGSGNNSANQTTGYAFGQGESADGVSGGGSGLYGGYADNVECVEKYTFNSSTKDLGIVNSMSMIPSAIVSASPTTISVIQSGGSSPVPSYFASTGDILYHNDHITEDTITFVDNAYLKIIFGKYQHPSDQRNYYGTQIIDKVRNVSILNFGTDSFSSGQYWDHYFSIVLDETNSRAYLLLLEYVSTGGGYNVIVVGGKTNGTDLFWETFKGYATDNGGGAGSGYIGNSLVSNKKMVGYNVPTSSAESTKTDSVNEASESPVSGKPKIGNGHAKIKLVRELHYNTIALPIDNQIILKPSDGSDWSLSSIPAAQKEPYMYDSSCMIVTGQMNCAELQESDNVYSYPYNNVSYNNTRYYYYLGGTKHIRGGKVKYRNTSGNHFPRFHIKFYDTQTWSAVDTLVSSSSGEATQDYIDVDLLFDVEANYLEIRGAADGFDFKDLKLLYD